MFVNTDYSIHRLHLHKGLNAKMLTPSLACCFRLADPKMGIATTERTKMKASTHTMIDWRPDFFMYTPDPQTPNNEPRVDQRPIHKEYGMFNYPAK